MSQKKLDGILANGVAEKYSDLFSKYEIYIAAPSWNSRNFPKEVYGKSINFIAVDDLKNKDFVELLNMLDGMAYGEEGIPIDKWVSYDMAMLPSAIIGFCERSKTAQLKIKDAFSNYKKNDKPKIDMDRYRGLIPISEYSAIPASDGKTWISHTLAVLQALSENGLGMLTKTVGLGILKPKYIVGVAQYDNSSLRVHTKFGRLEILSALTPAHSIPEMTFTYRVKVPEK